jgi:phosphatidylserine/phosphatidylglycerophosphate/cardiolipin synthase-like enzyme
MTYVHAKLMLVDDVWATIGSCNLHANSLSGHSELNVSIWDRTVVRELRCALLAEHLGVDTGDLDDRAALRLYQTIARANSRKMEAGQFDWQGLAFALPPEAYGK